VPGKALVEMVGERCYRRLVKLLKQLVEPLEEA
jgi:hypothetical protein